MPRTRPLDVLSRARILIVETGASNIDALRTVLQGYRSGTTEISDRSEALPCCVTVRPDVVLLGFQAPYLSDAEVSAQLQAFRQVTRAPIVAMAPFATAQFRDLVLAAGAAALVISPVDSRELLLHMRQALHRRLRELELLSKKALRTARIRESRREREAKLILAASARATALEEAICMDPGGRTESVVAVLAAELQMRVRAQRDPRRVMSRLIRSGHLRDDFIVPLLDQLPADEQSAVKAHPTIAALLKKWKRGRSSKAKR